MTTTLATSASASTSVVVPAVNPPAKIDWEQAITQLLAELSGTQEELFEVLAEKRARLASVDVSGMGELQTREQSLLERLQVCHARREELLAAAQREGLPGDSMTSLANRTVPATKGSSGEKLRKELATTASRMRLLQTQSLTNWVVAQRSLLHVSQLLEIIATGGRLQPTYGVGEGGLHARGGLVDHDA
ncbi:flagellar protein FlgN [Anatilimnocola floriformis]|uniref:flagellar protein FlgN n=1 Tax=Anatilimnocola floriformis TaxID=2948575 RepID=UPI0020C47D83|nr:flagellar protein FlgN [Anatilimnocola floriformis]